MPLPLAVMFFNSSLKDEGILLSVTQRTSLNNWIKIPWIDSEKVFKIYTVAVLGKNTLPTSGYVF